MLSYIHYTGTYLIRYSSSGRKLILLLNIFDHIVKFVDHNTIRIYDTPINFYTLVLRLHDFQPDHPYHTSRISSKQCVCTSYSFSRWSDGSK